MSGGVTRTEADTRALFDEGAFAAEQARLGRLWTLLGVASDLRRENDWFRTMLGGRSVFVQRFRDGLRGFENRCAHRSYPLRLAPRGHGPIICGFHHWRYDAEGMAAGIPNCQDAFGCKPRELGAALTRLELATCGDLIFARFPGRRESLQAFLGPIHDVLALLCADLRGGRREVLPGRMNWRLSQWISMDDYHLAAVHPRSLAAGRSYLRKDTLNYQRCGRHNTYFRGKDSGSITDWAGMLQRREPAGEGYRILHLFPDASIAYIPAIPLLGRRLPFSYILLQRHVPVAVDRTDLEYRVIAAPQRHLGDSRLARALAPFEPIRTRIVQRGARRVLREDQEVCENLQRHARQIMPEVTYGASEIRVGWFNEAYREALDAPH